MTIPRPAGIPLRPDLAALKTAERRSFIRAATAIVLDKEIGSAERILKSNWPDDHVATVIAKTAQSQTSTSDFPATTAVRVLPLLAPVSASARLLELATSLDMKGVGSIKLPYVGASGRPPAPFIEEGKPAPVVNLAMTSTTLGPVKKLLLL